MRMWNIDPIFMCKDHLLGEHVECHMFVACLNLGKKISGYLDKGLLEIHTLKRRHDRLAKEIKFRGYNHKSELTTFEEKECGKIDSQKNLYELMERCDKCKKRFFYFGGIL